ncbi:hypothetical protein [Micromonospora sp. NPDC049102]
MSVHEMNELFDIEIEEADVTTDTVESGAAVVPTIDRTITTCAFC